MTTLFFGQACADCSDASDSPSIAASVPSHTAEDCAGEPHVTKSAKAKVCQPGPWHGTLTITGYDCCDEVTVVLTNEDETSQTVLASLGSSESSVNFTFTIACSTCAQSYLQVITSDVDGCSQGWSGVATFAAGDPPP